MIRAVLLQWDTSSGHSGNAWSDWQDVFILGRDIQAWTWSGVPLNQTTLNSWCLLRELSLYVCMEVV